MTGTQLRKAFLTFFIERGHKVVPSSSLIPADQGVLFTSAGMQQLIPYLSGMQDVVVDFGQRHLCSVQKCFRANDIEEIGDDTHHTFFEMLGNWSIGESVEGGYFKAGAIDLALEFFLKVLGLEKDKLWITFFKGVNGIPADVEVVKLWQERGIASERIKGFGMADNFWGPTGITGPCGPCSEIHYDRGEAYGCGGEDCGPNCTRCKRFVELWNLVFMEYRKKEDGTYERLSQRNVDTGIGLERVVSVLQGKDSAYETDLFLPLIQKVEELSGSLYLEHKDYFRIIADHVRGAVFLIAAGVVPTNTAKGYVLRRILRRSIRYGKLLNLPSGFLVNLVPVAVDLYQDTYPELKLKEKDILAVVKEEEEKFGKTLERGLREFAKIVLAMGDSLEIPTAKVFDLYQSYGFPFELTAELAQEKGLKVDQDKFIAFQEQHQAVSRASVTQKFKSGLADHSLVTVKYHTATHLLLAALRQILGLDIYQRGSNITAERLRFDFNYADKLSVEQIKEVEDLVNEKIGEDLVVEMVEMPKAEALKVVKTSFDPAKYGPVVKVYRIGDFSVELCDGPHVARTSELGKFEIIKEESSSAGIRRIRAVLK